MTHYQYLLVRTGAENAEGAESAENVEATDNHVQAGTETESDNSPSGLLEATFPPEEFCKARELWQRCRDHDFRSARTGDFLRGYFPRSVLYLQQNDEEGEETARFPILSNARKPTPRIAADPLAEAFLNAYAEGRRWFVEDAEGLRIFFKTEQDAIEHARAETDKGRQLFNLDRYLDRMEERNVRCFLHHRPAISTNQLEVLCGFGRGTLSKVKNGNRKLSRKHYPKLLEVLTPYGFEPHVDLRRVESMAEAAELEEMKAATKNGAAAVMEVGDDEEMENVVVKVGEMADSEEE
ncbi:MAG: hypothetical protein AAF570_21090 [Bacteroidota bacterium]